MKIDYTAMAIEYIEGLLVSDDDAFIDNYEFIKQANKEQYGEEFDMGKYCENINYLLAEIRDLLETQIPYRKESGE